MTRKEYKLMRKRMRLAQFASEQANRYCYYNGLSISRLEDTIDTQSILIEQLALSIMGRELTQ